MPPANLYDPPGSFARAVFPGPPASLYGPPVSLYGSTQPLALDPQTLAELRRLLMTSQPRAPRDPPDYGIDRTPDLDLGGRASQGSGGRGLAGMGLSGLGHGPQGAMGTGRDFSMGYDPTSIAATLGGLVGGLFGPVGSLVGTQAGAIIGGSGYQGNPALDVRSGAQVGPVDRYGRGLFDPTAVELGLAGYGRGGPDRDTEAGGVGPSGTGGGGPGGASGPF